MVLGNHHKIVYYVHFPNQPNQEDALCMVVILQNSSENKNKNLKKSNPD